MIELEIHHSHGMENHGGALVMTLTKFTLNVDGVKNHGDYHTTCPACGRALHMTVFPGVNLLRAIKVQFRRAKKSMHPVTYVLLFLTFPPVLATGALMTAIYPNWLPDTPWSCLVALYLLAGVVTWWSFAGDVLTTTRPRCFVHDQMPPYHWVYYRGKPMSGTEHEELALRLPYYS
jgi:hypothetical protein